MKVPFRFTRKDAISLALIVLVIAGVRLWQHRDMPSGPAPTLRGTLLDGRPYQLPAHPAQPMLVHFWATWCSICKAEQGSIESVIQDHPAAITIAMQSGKPAAIVQHLQQQGLHFPVLNDPDGQLAAAWGVHAVPASFILGPDGTVRFIEVGYTSELGLRLRLWLAQWL